MRKKSFCVKSIEVSRVIKSKVGFFLPMYQETYSYPNEVTNFLFSIGKSIRQEYNFVSSKDKADGMHMFCYIEPLSW